MLTHQRLCLVKIRGYADKRVLCLRNYFTRSDTKVIGTVVEGDQASSKLKVKPGSVIHMALVSQEWQYVAEYLQRGYCLKL